MLLIGGSKLLTTLVPEALTQVHFPFEIALRVLKPDPTFLEEAVQRIAVQSQKRGELMLGEPVSAVSLDRHILERGARGVASGRDH